MDALSFGPGCTLDQFSKMWGTSARKSIFPYELYETIEELECSTVWPQMCDFKSTLSSRQFEQEKEEIMKLATKINDEIGVRKQDFLSRIGANFETESLVTPVELETYVNMWIYFEQSKKNGTMTNMLDYLCFYNQIDTEVLAEAMKNYTRAFIENFKINPNEYITLPGVSERILWSFFDDSRYRPYSFNMDFADVAKTIRSQLAGGLSCVFSRHVELVGSENRYAHAVHYAENGEPFNQIIAYDVNSESKIMIIFF